MKIYLVLHASLDAPLTRREWDVLGLMANDCSNDQIAQQLVISPNTVNVHLYNIFQKLEVHTRLGAVLYALGRGWLSLQGEPPPIRYL